MNESSGKFLCRHHFSVIFSLVLTGKGFPLTEKGHPPLIPNTFEPPPPSQKNWFDVSGKWLTGEGKLSLIFHWESVKGSHHRNISTRRKKDLNPRET